MTKKKKMSMAEQLSRHVEKTAKEFRKQCKERNEEWKLIIFRPRRPRNGFKS